MSDKDTAIAGIVAQRSPKRRLGWRIGAALVVMVAVGAGWYGTRGSGETVTWVTEPATLADLTVTITATGSVQPTTQVDVSSELSGTLAAVEVDYNDSVTVGQVLARLDDTKLRAQAANAEASRAAAEGRVAQAEATLREAEATFTSESELDRRGISTRLSLVTAEAAHDRAKAALAIARADLTLADANLQLARADLDKTIIRSPIDGIVLNRAVEAGQIVASSLNAPVLFTLAQDLSRMELRVDVDEADIGRVAVGQPAEFTVDAYPGRSFPATITQVRYAPETTESVVTYKAVLSVENRDGLLRPGMTATATITVTRLDDALTVPAAAMRFAPPVESAQRERARGLLGLVMPRRPSSNAGTPTGRSLWVLRDGAPVEVQVTPGESDGTRIAILSGELFEGDAVITDRTVAR